MKWVLWQNTAHAVDLEDGDRTLLVCGLELIGRPPWAEFDELVFPDQPCVHCKTAIAMALVEEEPLDRIAARGYETFDEAQSL
jgi:hypothetical protein